MRLGPLYWPPLMLLLGGCASLGGGGRPAVVVGADRPAAAASQPASAPSRLATATASAGGRAPATTSPVNAAAPSASGVPPGTPQPATPPTGPGQPYATVIREATKREGLFTLYQKDEKVWLALRPEDFGRPLFLSPKLATGIGEAGLFGGSMEDEHLIEFRRVHNQVQMLVRNTEYMAPAGSPEARAVAAAFSPSLLASTPVASQPDPTTKAVLVDAAALFVNDMNGTSMRLQRAFRQGYAFDGRNSAITSVRVRPEDVQLEVLQHFATGAIAVRQPGTPPGVPSPSVPQTVPDARSLFVTAHYSLSALPAEPMRPRAADPRIGYFTTSQWNLGDDTSRTPVVRYANRWRLEKQDPAAPLSPPVKPIVYWLDRTIPVPYREAITAGILEWNKAFEKIGFRDAIVVKVQPDDADFDTLDGGASVRWMTNAAPNFGAIGPSHVDPRSGEILAANIGIESLSSRNVRASRAQILPGTAAAMADQLQLGATAVTDLTGADGAAAAADASRRLDGTPDPRACLEADQAAEQLGYALDVLAARDELDPAGAEAQSFVLAYLKDVTMHEVGHTLGLRHNFRASRAYTEQQLADPEFTRTHALTGSVMEYAPVNLAAPGAPRVTPFQTTLGPYDYWAIEYAYKPLAPADERGELDRIAARSSQRELAYGTDEDNFLGIDPDALMFDLGSDPLAFARKRLAIARDLFRRQEERRLPAERDWSVLRRSLNYALNDVARATGVLARQIGGVRTLRDFPGSGGDPLLPVPAATQREALDQISGSVFAADSLVVSPTLQRRLAPDFQEREESLQRGAAAVVTDYSVTDRLFTLQRVLLGQLLSDEVAGRIIDSQGKVAARGEAFQLSELYGRLERDIWSEIEGGGSAGAASAAGAVRAAAVARDLDARVATPSRGGVLDIPAPRRALQREHVNRLTASLLRPVGAGRADARSLLRADAIGLQARIAAATRRPGLGADTRAHLLDCAETLRQALQARIARPAA